MLASVCFWASSNKDIIASEEVRNMALILGLAILVLGVSSLSPPFSTSNNTKNAGNFHCHHPRIPQKNQYSHRHR